MKTSNKILLGFSACYILGAIAVCIPTIREYKRIKPEFDRTFEELAQAQIRTLVVDNAEITYVQRTTDQQFLHLQFYSPSTKVYIHSDTLFVQNIPQFTARLPHLETYLLNGVPQTFNQ